MKKITKILIVLLLILGCSEPHYNTITPKGDNIREEILPPFKVEVEQGIKSSYVLVEWDKVLDVESYSVYRSEDPNGVFIVIAQDIKNYYTSRYHDFVTEPGKIYYYKIKSYSSKYGYSDFSMTASGFRSGIANDSFEDDNASNNAKNIDVENGIEQLHSIYPSKDTDWVKFSSSSNSFYKIEIIRDQLAKSDFNYLYCDFYDNNLKPIFFDYIYFNNEMPDKNYKIIYTDNTSDYYLNFYYGFSTYITGNYKIKVAKITTPPPATKSLVATKNLCNFIKLSWQKNEIAEKYYIYKSNTTTGEYKLINVLREYSSEVNYPYTFKQVAYDNDVSCDTKYYYKIKAWNKYGFSDFSDYTEGTILKLDKDIYENNDSTTDAKTLLIEETQYHNIYPKNDIDWIKFSGTNNTRYNIELNPNSYNINTLDFFLYLYDNNDRLITKGIATVNNLSITNWLCENSSDYYLKAGANLTEKYEIKIYTK